MVGFRSDVLCIEVLFLSQAKTCKRQALHRVDDIPAQKGMETCTTWKSFILAVGLQRKVHSTNASNYPSKKRQRSPIVCPGNKPRFRLPGTIPDQHAPSIDPHMPRSKLRHTTELLLRGPAGKRRQGRNQQPCQRICVFLPGSEVLRTFLSSL